MRVPGETFDALAGLPRIRHAFLCRVPGLDVRTDRADALARLAAFHLQARLDLGFPAAPMATAKQAHGSNIAVLRKPVTQEAPDTDGLVTNVPNLSLGIYVADCCAVYIADPVKRAIALLHSGKKGTDLAIATRAVETMTREFGSNPADMVAQLSPCIRPPLYETDFAAEIIRQLNDAGVARVADNGANTGADLNRYYSYRMEKGQTGRLLALLMLE
jgi:copper oxidase (laccase) domain-containing protein